MRPSPAPPRPSAEDAIGPPRAAAARLRGPAAAVMESRAQKGAAQRYLMSARHGRFGRFLNAMDAKAWLSVAVSATLLVFVLFMFLFGREFLNLERDGQLERLVSAAAQSHWAVPIIVAIFVLLALTGFPQVLLIAATIIAFGAGQGAFYAWLATMISATFTFGLGWWYGGRFARRFGGERVQSTIDFIGRRGVLASALIRLVPSAPFIVVNAAAGAARIPIWKYWLGTGAGIIPKIVLVAALGAAAPDGHSLSEGVEGVLAFLASRSPADFAGVGLVIVAWIAILLVARRAIARISRDDAGRPR